MDSVEPPKKADVKSASIWPPVCFLAGIAGLLFVASVIDKESPGSGGAFFGWVLALGFLALFVWLAWSNSFRKTVSNAASIIKFLVIALVICLVLGALFQFIGIAPSNDARDAGGIPNQWPR